MVKITNEQFYKLKQLDRIEFLLEIQRLIEAKDKGDYMGVVYYSIYYVMAWFVGGSILILLSFIAFKETNPYLVIKLILIFKYFSQVYLYFLLIIVIILVIVTFRNLYLNKKEWDKIYVRFFNNGK